MTAHIEIQPGELRSLERAADICHRLADLGVEDVLLVRDDLLCMIERGRRELFSVSSDLSPARIREINRAIDAAELDPEDDPLDGYLPGDPKRHAVREAL